MALSKGTRVGPYEIIVPIGVGGMGEVYRAEDTRLGRQVAIKVLPEHLASDPDRMARLQREARVLASLNHPNIASIHGIEDTDAGGRALILELVEGPTLADRLKDGALQIDETVLIARQIAEALETAHESDIVHRDLKPANIKISEDLKVTVLDFGLAKALTSESSASADDSRSPTLTHAPTQAGVLLGTAAYMSPEQARGRSVDKRSDVWAFGCVLYEMLTGRRLFHGETISDILAAVLRADIELDTLPLGTPSGLRQLLERCLMRDATERLRDIGEARIALDRLSSDTEPPVNAVKPAPFGWRSMVAGFLVGVFFTLGLFAFLGPKSNGASIRKYELAVDGLDARPDVAPRLSPDGSRIAYSSAGRLWIRSFDELQPREIPESEGAHYPFWSPDSRAIGFYASTKLWRAPVDGGPAISFLDLRANPVPGAGAAWGQNDEIVFSYGNTGLYTVSARGGDEGVLLDRVSDVQEDDVHFHGPSALPGERGLLFVVHGSTGADSIAVFSGDRRRELLKFSGQYLSHPVYAPSGHILFHKEPSTPGIWAVPFSLQRLEVGGEPFLVSPDANFPSVGADGSLAYVGGIEAGLRQLVWLDRRGEILERVGEPSPGIGLSGFPAMALAPDGSGAVITETEGGNDLWMYEFDRETRTRITFSAMEQESQPALGEGGRIAFSTGLRDSDRQLMLMDLHEGEAKALGRGMRPAFSPDGEYLVYSALTAPGDLEHVLWAMTLTREDEPKRLAASSQGGFFASVSPDGRFIAYSSRVSGRSEIYLSRFPSGEGKWQASTTGGSVPQWDPKGDRLFYTRGNNELMEVNFQSGPTPSFGRPVELFSVENMGIELARGFGYVPSEDRFLMIQSTTPSRAATMTLVRNWFAEFEER